MKTSKDEFVRGGGGTPPYAGFAPNVLPAVQTLPEEEDLQIGVSTISGHIETDPNSKSPKWFVIRCTYGREKKAYDYLLQKGIDAFYPTITRKKEIEGEKQLVEESRLPNLFFAHSDYDTLKKYIYDNVHKETKHLRFYYNQHHDGTIEYAITTAIPNERKMLEMSTQEINERLQRELPNLERLKQEKELITSQIENEISRFVVIQSCYCIKDIMISFRNSQNGLTESLVRTASLGTRLK